MNRSISKALREYRKEKNWTQESFADKIGVNRVTYINYENGTRTPDCYVLKKINEVTGLSVDYILGISETKNVAQSDIAKTTGLSEKAIEFLHLTKVNNDFLNRLINLVAEEERLPINYYWEKDNDLEIKEIENKIGMHDNFQILDEIKKHWEINDFNVPIKDKELANITPFDYSHIEDLYLEDDEATIEERSDYKDTMKKNLELCESKGAFLRRSNLLDSIGQYMRFKNGGIGLKGVNSIELLDRNHCITLFIGGKYVKFPSEESDKIVERLLLDNVIDSLKEFKKKYNESNI